MPLFHDALPFDYTVIDTETTGISAAADRIVEIAAIRVRDHIPVEKFLQRINPGVPISPRASEIHGITDEMLKGCPPPCAVFPEFIAFIGDDTLIGHNIRNYDIPRIESDSGCSLSNRVIDTLALAGSCLAKLPPILPNHRQASLCDFFGIPHDHDHSALGDASAAMKLYQKLIVIAVDETSAAPYRSATADTTLSLMQRIAQKAPTFFAGKRIVFTGDFLKFNRSDAVAFVRTVGGEVKDSGSVTKSTSFLVVGDKKSDFTRGDRSTKYLTAEKYGIPILTESEFIAVLRGALHD